MSTTATAFAPKEILKGNLTHASETYAKDLAHIPADKLTASPMGCARAPQEFSAECIGFNTLVRRILKGEEGGLPDPEARQAFYAQFDTIEKLQVGIRNSTAAVIEALDGVSDEDLARTVTAPWGRELSLFALVQTAATHMMYHDGQLNYIQSCYGDAVNHWAD